MKFKSVEKNFVIMEIRLDQLKLVFSYKILLKLFSLKKYIPAPSPGWVLLCTPGQWYLRFRGPRDRQSSVQAYNSGHQLWGE